jgi:hypothetical protein
MAVSLSITADSSQIRRSPFLVRIALVADRVAGGSSHDLAGLDGQASTDGDADHFRNILAAQLLTNC